MLDFTRRFSLSAPSVLAVLIFTLLSYQALGKQAAPLSQEANPAAEYLKKNANFVKSADILALKKNAIKQTPKIYWIGCSDSRVSETQLIGAELGEVFVERNVANLFKAEDARTSAGMEYAIHHLNISHVVLVGHEGCGGCKAALDAARDADKKAPAAKLKVGEKAIADWIAPIKKTAMYMLKFMALTGGRKPPTDEEKKKQLSLLVRLNVLQQVHNILASPVVKDANRRGRHISVYGWVYDLETGKIKQVWSAKTDKDPIL